ncbi:MAG: CDP-alcohol phosphatidyltransferase family protein [Chloroflexia bacterium]
MLSTLFGAQLRRFTFGIGKALSRSGVSPNTVTVLGLLLNALVAVVLASGSFLVGGFLVLLAGMFDMLDGAVARAGGKVSVFGGFLDSTLDRYSEAVLFLGLLVYFTRASDSVAVVLIYITMVGSIMTSYARARAEASGLKNDSGLFQRTERVVLLGLCLIFQAPLLALWTLSIGTNLTAAYRVYAVYKAAHV